VSNLYRGSIYFTVFTKTIHGV